MLEKLKILLALIFPVPLFFLFRVILEGALLKYPWISLLIACGCFYPTHIYLWWSRASDDDKKRGWVYVNRWSYVLGLLVIAIISMILVLYEFHRLYRGHFNPDRFPWVLAVPLVGSPVALLIWYIRDQVKDIERELTKLEIDQKSLDLKHRVQDLQNKVRDQEQKDLERYQIDFHKYVEWASTSQDVSLRKVALTNLKPFITGEIYGSPRANDFQIPALSLLVSLLDLGYQEEGSPEGPQPESVYIARQVFSTALKLFQLVFSPQYSEAMKAVRTSSSFSLIEEGKRFLSKTHLPGLNLKNAKLQDADFQDADLKGADLQGANLRNSDLRGANLEVSTLLDADLRGVDLKGASLRGAEVQGAKLKGSILVDVDLREANLSGNNLANANLVGADLSGTILQGTDLSSSDLENAELSGADLREANLEGANLRGARLVGIITKASNFKNANLEGVQGSFQLDVETLRVSHPLPHHFLVAGGFSEEFINSFDVSGSTVTITFTQEVWGQLLPIENALSVYLKDDYFIEKSSNRIVVKLTSSQQIGQALQGVLPVLMAIDEEAPNEVARVEISPAGAEMETINLGEIRDLKDMIAPPELSITQATLLELYKHPINPLRFTHPYFRRFLENIPEEKSTFEAIYEKFRDYGQAMVSIGQLKRGEKDALPPGEAVEESQDNPKLPREEPKGHPEESDETPPEED